MPLGSPTVLMLALDTASPAITVAVHDGHRVLASRTTVDARRHGELLAPAMLADVMADAGAGPRDLTDMAVGVGPGPYTGLRVGLITARTAASVVGAALHGVCSLDVIALEAAPGEPFVVATDARRHEVHWARYDAARTDSRVPPSTGPPTWPRGCRPGQRWSVAAPALCRRAGRSSGCRTLLSTPPPPCWPRAVVDGRVEVLPAEPLYLRRPDAAPPGPMKPVLPPRRR